MRRLDWSLCLSINQIAELICLLHHVIVGPSLAIVHCNHLEHSSLVTHWKLIMLKIMISKEFPREN